MTAPPIDESVAVARVKQVFRFLKAFAEQNLPVRRRMADHHWAQWLNDLPLHPSILVGEVQVTGTSDAAPAAEGAGDQPLITIRRPVLTPPPDPPESILPFLETGWNDPDQPVEIVQARDVPHNGTTKTERLDSDKR